MIIESMSRKDDSFGELYDYIRKGMDEMTDQPNAYWHNTDYYPGQTLFKKLLTQLSGDCY